MQLGKLERVELRDIWKHEALDFTKWLSKEKNLSLLSDAIGTDTISLIQTEANVGSFNVDILAEEGDEGRKVIIENQLEKTNHDHLGKLITYSAGHDAEIIIWLVKEVREEHKHAIEWLNEHVDSKVNFFLVEIELWKIGESAPAPMFQVVSRPNDWAKAIKRASGKGELTDHKTKQLAFWEGFNDYCALNKASFNQRKPYPQHWYNVAVGSSKAHISLNIVKSRIGCSLWISDSKPTFDKLITYREAIESKLGKELIWDRKDNAKASEIVIWNDTIGLNASTERWDQAFKWLIDHCENYKTVFSEYL